MHRNIAVHAALKAGALGVLSVLIPFLGIVLTGRWLSFSTAAKIDSRFPPRSARVLGSGGSRRLRHLFPAAPHLHFHFSFPAKYIDTVLTIAQKFGYNPAYLDLQASIHTLFTPSGLAFIFFFGLIFAWRLPRSAGRWRRCFYGLAIPACNLSRNRRGSQARPLLSSFRTRYDAAFMISRAPGLSSEIQQKAQLMSASEIERTLDPAGA